MERLVEPDRLYGRIVERARQAIRTNRLAAKTDCILDVLPNRGALESSAVPGLLGVGVDARAILGTFHGLSRRAHRKYVQCPLLRTLTALT